MAVRAKRFIEYESEAELQQLIPQLDKSEPLLHIGAGSNLLFRGDFPGTILHAAIRGTEQVGEDEERVLLRAGAAVVWDDFVAHTVRLGLGGAENLSLIPGEVGASAVQNIGAYGAEVKDIITKVEAIDLHTGKKRVFTNEECQYAYRQSIFKQQLRGQYAITYVTYCLSRHPRLNLDYGGLRAKVAQLQAASRQLPVSDASLPVSGASLLCSEVPPSLVRQAVIAIRQEKLPDPKLLGNAGSFFMNPIVSQEQFLSLRNQYPDIPHYDLPDGSVKIPAGWLIDQCGWKGRSLGRAAVYQNQALILVNLGGAAPQEIVNLSDRVCQSVQEKFGIAIHPEVNFI